MRILLMSPWGDREIGGLSSHLLSLDKVITLAGYESRLSSHQAIPRNVERLAWFASHLWPGSKLGSATIMIETLHGLLALRDAVHGDTRLVHAHDVGCLHAAHWISRFLQVPVVLTVHSQYALGDIVAGYLRRGSRDERWAWSLERGAFRKADFVFTVTTRLRDFVLREAHVDPARVSVRLNFVDTDEFKPRDPAAAREILQAGGVPVGAFGDRCKVVLYPGRLSPRKGVGVLIRAARIVTDRNPQAHVVITGEGPQYAELLQLRSDLGLDANITFLGNLPPDLVKFVYNLANVVVLPSVTLEGVEEGTPMSALEAMASGVPVVASEVGGLAEIIADGETGYLVPEGSVEQLADRILDTLDQDQTSIAERAREYVREHRSLESYARELKIFLAERGIVTDDGGVAPRARDMPRPAIAWSTPFVKGRRAVSYATTTYREYFRHRQWGVGVALVPIHRFLESDLHPDVQWLHPQGGDEYLADPFGVIHEGRLQVLCERYRRATHEGVLATFDWPATGDTPEARAVLPQKGHASYPFLLEHEGQIYCIPETSAAGEVALYRADAFPDRWTKVATLLGTFAGVDSTVIRFDGRWWIFTMDVNAPDRRLHVWFADELEGPWTPHPKNPVADSLASARPAGTPFLWHGNLYRPAQDCSKTYGGRVALNCVEELSPTAFHEYVVSYAEPDRSGPYPLGLHTLSSVGDVTLIDGFRNVFSGIEFRRRLVEGPPNQRRPAEPREAPAMSTKP